MKKLFLYLGSFLALSAIFTFCYYSGYKRSLKEFNRRGVEKHPEETQNGIVDTADSFTLLEKVRIENENAKEVNAAKQQQMESQADSNSQTVPVGTMQNRTILPTVEYFEETYSVPENRLTEKQTVAPGFLIGMTREELEAYVAHYMENLPLSEYEAGLLSYEIISFSESKVVLRKTYDSTKVPYKFYVNISDGMVTVYYSDLKTVYEYTHIPAVDLPEELRYSLIEGIYLKDAEELYSLLEGFSS